MCTGGWWPSAEAYLSEPRLSGSLVSTEEPKKQLLAALWKDSWVILKKLIELKSLKQPSQRTEAATPLAFVNLTQVLVLVLPLHPRTVQTNSVNVTSHVRVNTRLGVLAADTHGIYST